MNIQLPKEQREIIAAMVASGRFASADEAVSEGIRLLASHETLRQEIQVGIDQADRGELHEHDSVFAQLKAMAAAVADR